MAFFTVPRRRASANFDDAGIVTATTYTYFVVAYNAQGDSAPSNKVTVTIGAS